MKFTKTYLSVPSIDVIKKMYRETKTDIHTFIKIEKQPWEGQSGKTMKRFMVYNGNTKKNYDDGFSDKKEGTGSHVGFRTRLPR